MICSIRTFFLFFFFFFFNDTATTEIYTLSLHDALPISVATVLAGVAPVVAQGTATAGHVSLTDRKSTRLNSSHGYISYAVFCLKKKKKKKKKLKIIEINQIKQDRLIAKVTLHSLEPARI